MTAAAIAAILTTAAWFCQKAPLRVALGGQEREVYLAEHIDYFWLYDRINKDTPPDSRIWLINMRRDTYHIDRPVFSDYLFEDWTFRKLLWESNDKNDLRSRLRRWGFGLSWPDTIFCWIPNEQRSLKTRDREWKTIPNFG
jgi:hypothetical protein